MRDKISFSTNVPTHVLIEGPGAEQGNRAGDPEYRYFCVDEKVMWVPPEVHGEIELLQRRHGAAVEVAITKQQTKRGAPVRWIVEHIAEESAAAAAAPSSRTGEWERQPGQGWTRREPQPPARSNGHQPPTQPRPAPTPVPPPYTADAELPLTGADKLAGALAAAIDAATEAAIYGERHGLTLRFDAGDIRALAATLLIGEQRNGGAR